jgi:antitoxin component YwqK of YwqJK toxin-antitoxin module
MKFNLFIYFLFLFAPFLSIAQNKKDKEGKRTGKWVFTWKDKPNSGVSPNGKIEEGYFNKGRKEGVWIKYHPDGKTPLLKGNYINNRPEGEYKRFFKTGKVKESGAFGKEHYKGDLTRYHTNGKVAYSGSYNNDGMESGSIKYYYENGNIELEYTAKNGVVMGELKRYYENGSLKEVQTFNSKGKPSATKTYKMAENPVPKVETTKTVIYPPTVKNPRTKGLKFVPNGYNKIYNESDEIWMDGEFKNGQLWDGKVFDYSRDGILLKVRVFKLGKYHSDGQL